MQMAMSLTNLVKLVGEDADYRLFQSDPLEATILRHRHMLQEGEKTPVPVREPVGGPHHPQRAARKIRQGFASHFVQRLKPQMS